MYLYVIELFVNDKILAFYIYYKIELLFVHVFYLVYVVENIVG